VTVTLQIHAPPPKGDTFHFEPQPLLERMLARDADGSPGADDAMPRQAAESTKRPNHLSRRAWEPGPGSDVPIGGHLPARYLPNGIREYG
jgi:hypothetical protein